MLLFLPALFGGTTSPFLNNLNNTIMADKHGCTLIKPSFQVLIEKNMDPQALYSEISLPSLLLLELMSSLKYFIILSCCRDGEE